VFDRLSRSLSGKLARYLEKPTGRYDTFAITPAARLQRILEPGDVILVEGKSRVSTAIKYLTQSTWSHAAIFIGDQLGKTTASGEALCLIEADLQEGVIAAPLSKYYLLNTRICRPVGIQPEDQAALTAFLIDNLGSDYDLRNVWDLARYLMPTPPIPVRFRRRMLELGSGDPTQMICSTLIARAFQEIRYPILPHIETREARRPGRRAREIFHIRHHSLFTPRDFDVSPYFRIVKPTIYAGFNYKSLTWYDEVPGFAKPIDYVSDDRPSPEIAD
jgi:Permuted papain-like amidase enzyme, YaeF/YiiX, C92 family